MTGQSGAKDSFTVPPGLRVLRVQEDTAECPLGNMLHCVSCSDETYCILMASRRHCGICRLDLCLRCQIRSDDVTVNRKIPAVQITIIMWHHGHHLIICHHRCYSRLMNCAISIARSYLATFAWVVGKHIFLLLSVPGKSNLFVYNPS